MERMNITLIPGVHMVVLSGSVSESYSKYPAKVQGIQVAVPHNTLTRNKILVLTK